MKRIESSTKIQPLLFFEQFLKKESLSIFEKEFYEANINPSFKAYKELGYVEYIKDLYEDIGEVKPVKVVFLDVLENRLKVEFDLSVKYINLRREEIENIEKNSDIYLNQQIVKIDRLKKSLDSDYSNKSIIIEFLDKIRNYLSGLLGQKPFQNIRHIKITGRTYFDLKDDIKVKHLKKLYDATVSLSIIDEDIVPMEDFINVLISPKLPDSKYKIIFNKDNRLSVYYLNLIAVLFNDLRPSIISRSKSFIKKGGNILDANHMNKINSFLNQNDTSKYSYIKKEIEQILPK